MLADLFRSRLQSRCVLCPAWLRCYDRSHLSGFRAALTHRWSASSALLEPPARESRWADRRLQVSRREFSGVKIDVEEWRTLPNALTGARLVAVPALLASWYAGSPAVAAGLFGAAALTDFLDGYLARRWNQTSSLGALMDPLADKLLVAASLLVLTEEASCWVVTLPAAIIISRELSVSSLREWVHEHRPELGSLSVAWHGKLKTFLQMLALQGMLCGVALQHEAPAEQSAEHVKESDKLSSHLTKLVTSEIDLRLGSFTRNERDLAPLIYTIGLGMLWSSAVLACISGVTYFRFALRI